MDSAAALDRGWYDFSSSSPGLAPLYRGTMKNDALETRALLRHEERGRSVWPQTTAAGHGPWLRPEDFDVASKPSARLEVGRTPTLARLRDQHYMPRPERVAAARAALEECSAKTPAGRVGVFGISGAAGVGKSVLLLLLMEDLVRAGRRVLWLGGRVERLGEALRATPEAPEFVFVDALYAPDVRTSLDLGRLGRLIAARAEAPRPVVVTSGEATHHAAFRADSRHCGFALHEWELGLVGWDEGRRLLSWHAARGGRAQCVGPAFARARRDAGLFVELAFELEHDDLRGFTQRFCKNAAGELRHTLWQALGLNRLGLGVPTAWLTDARGAATSSAGTTFVTHPRIADTLARALRPTPKTRANDLGDAFARALRCGDEALMVKLLRAYGGLPTSEPAHLLGTVDPYHLAVRCGHTWCDRGATRAWRSADDRADALVSLACWCRHEPSLAVNEPDGFVGAALSALDRATDRWPTLWLRLHQGDVARERVVAWAARALSEVGRFDHPQWALVWESAFTTASASSEARRALVESGRRWLAGDRTPEGRATVERLLDPGTNPEPEETTRVTLCARGLPRLCEVVAGEPRWSLDALKQRGGGSGWSRDWVRVYAQTSPAHARERAELARLGENWLRYRAVWSEGTFEVMAGLLDLGSRDPVLFRKAKEWLRDGRAHPAWARMLARSLRANPHDEGLLSLVTALRGAPVAETERSEMSRWLWPLVQEGGLREPLRAALADLLAVGG